MNSQPNQHPGRILVFVMLALSLLVGAAAWAKKDDNNGLGPVKKLLGDVTDVVDESTESITSLVIGGDSLTTEYYHITEDLDLGDVIFDGPTVIVADGDIVISGHPVITANAEVTIYFAGDFTMSGKASINNEGRPKNFKLYATREFDSETMTDMDRQKISLNGNSTFTGVVYAPEAQYTSNGGGGTGATYGSVLAYNMTFNGVPGPFHYDESLISEIIPNQPFSTSGYRPIRDPEQLVNNDPNLGSYRHFIDSFF